MRRALAIVVAGLLGSVACDAQKEAPAPTAPTQADSPPPIAQPAASPVVGDVVDASADANVADAGDSAEAPAAQGAPSKADSSKKKSGSSALKSLGSRSGSGSSDALGGAGSAGGLGAGGSLIGGGSRSYDFAVLDAQGGDSLVIERVLRRHKSGLNPCYSFYGDEVDRVVTTVEFSDAGAWKSHGMEPKNDDASDCLSARGRKVRVPKGFTMARFAVDIHRD